LDPEPSKRKLSEDIAEELSGVANHDNQSDQACKGTKAKRSKRHGGISDLRAGDWIRVQDKVKMAL
jgi:hypothetical protein